MRLIRIKAYIIDFIVLALILFLIGAVIPQSDRLKSLKAEQNTNLEEILAGRISFGEYVDTNSEVYYQAALEEGIPYLLYLLCMMWYFVFIPYMWKGRTLGCYICHVQVERFDKGKLHMWQLMVRYSFVFGLGYVVLNNLAVLLLSSTYYFPVISVIAIFQFVLAIFCAITVLLWSEKRGLHELLSNTELTKIIEPKKKRK